MRRRCIYIYEQIYLKICHRELQLLRVVGRNFHISPISDFSSRSAFSSIFLHFWLIFGPKASTISDFSSRSAFSAIFPHFCFIFGPTSALLVRFWSKINMFDHFSPQNQHVRSFFLTFGSRLVQNQHFWRAFGPKSTCSTISRPKTTFRPDPHFRPFF